MRKVMQSLVWLISTTCCSIVIEGGIFISHGIWLIRTRRLRKIAKLAGKSFDDLPQSEEYHVDVERKGSIAASRDFVKDLVERRGSVALARDLERCADVTSGSISFERPVPSANNPLDTVPELAKTKAAGIRVVEAEVGVEGVEVIDYGTMTHGGASGSRVRPGYVRQDSTVSSASLFKNPAW